MALTDNQKAELLPKLVSYLTEQKWRNLSVNEMDAGYNLLSEAEKQGILNSIISGDNEAKTIIREKLTGPIALNAQSQAELYIELDSIPLSVVINKF